MTHHRKLLAAASLVAALSLAGCWGDSNNDVVAPVASTDVPDSAGASTASWVSFILGLSGSDESSEPLTIKDTLDGPADEGAEPTPLT